MTTAKWIILIAGLVAIAFLAYYFLFDGLYFGADKDKAGFDVKEVVQQVSRGEAILFDVRTSEELEELGYAKGATHFDLARLKAGELPQNSKDMKIYTYCRSGARAAEAKAIFQQAGFIDVQSIGGLSDWQEAGGEVVE